MGRRDKFFAFIAAIALLVIAVSAFNGYREKATKERAEQDFAAKQAALLAERNRQWNARRNEVLAEIDKALKEGRGKTAEALVQRYRDAAGEEFGRYEQPIKIAIAVEKLNAIPQPLFVEREAALDELARLEPNNPRWKQELAAARRATEAQRRKDEEYERRSRKSQGVRIGMTQEHVMQSSWGRPERVNRTTNALGVREQWVYGNGHYLYFQDGILTSIQTRN